MHTLCASVAVLCCTAAVTVKMPNTFTYEGYTDIHFVNSSCSGNSRAAVVEHRHRIPHREISEIVRRTLRETGSFPRARAEPEPRRQDDDILAAVQRNASTNIRRISRTTGVVQNFEP